MVRIHDIITILIPVKAQGYAEMKQLGDAFEWTKVILKRINRFHW